MNKCKDKKCPSDKICNPVSGRCVKKTGKLGKIALALKKKGRSRSKSKSRSKARSKVRSKVRSKACPPDKILNPKTGRCVKRTGSIGRKLLGKSKSKKVKSRRRKSLKKSKKRRSRKTKMQKFVEKQLEKRKKCKNEWNLIYTEETKDIDPKKLYVSPSGYCYHINDDIVPHLLKSPKPEQDPYTTALLWKDNAEFRKTIYNHPGLTTSEKVKLFEKFLKPQALTSKELLFCLQYAAIFRKIGELGLTMWSDYSKGFKASLRELTATRSLIDKLPDADKKFLLRMKPKQLRSKSLEKIFNSYASGCIHGVGSDTLKYYFYYVHSICTDWDAMKKIVKTEQGQKLLKEYEPNKKYFCEDFQGIIHLFPVNMSIISFLVPKKAIYLMAYKYDEENAGMYSFMSRFGNIATTLNPRSVKFYSDYNYQPVFRSAWVATDKKILQDFGERMTHELGGLKGNPLKNYIKKYLKVSEGSESGYENAL